MTNRFVVNAITHYSTLLGKNFGKENFLKIILNFIGDIGRKPVTIWRCPISH